MDYIILPYCVCYRDSRGIDHEEYFKTEIDMEGHVNIWFDGDEEYIEYYYYNKPYTPHWAI